MCLKFPDNSFPRLASRGGFAITGLLLPTAVSHGRTADFAARAAVEAQLL